MNIEIKAIEQYFPVVQFIMLFKWLQLELLDEILNKSVAIQNQAILQYQLLMLFLCCILLVMQWLYLCTVKYLYSFQFSLLKSFFGA